MTETCSGFVLKTFPYSESSLIVKVLSDSYGIITLMVRGARKRGRSGSGLALYNSMSHITFSIHKKENRDMFSPSSVSAAKFYPSLHTDFAKTQILLYMAESIYKSSSKEHHGNELFLFVESEMDKLEKTNRLQHFPQQFICGLIQVYGITPHGQYSDETPQFSLNESTFLPPFSQIPADRVDGPAAKYISELFTEGIELTDYDGNVRRETRRRLEEYLRIHLDAKFNLLSGEILEMVFS